jgi:heme exporter protein B
MSISNPERQNLARHVSVFEAFKINLVRDLTLAFRKRGDFVNPFVFFIIVVSLFPLAVSPDSAFLARIAPGVLWITALLAAMLSLDSMYRADFEDGSLETLLLSPHPLYFLVLAKNCAHWLVTGLPVVIISPFLAMMLSYPFDQLGILFVTLLLGTPFLTLVGSVAVALTVGLGSRGLILAVIVLPMCVPILVFGTLAVNASLSGLPVEGYLALMGAMLGGALSLAPLASSLALRISVA